MSNIRRLFDKGLDDKSSSDEEGRTDSFAGGHKSGLAVAYPNQRKDPVLRIQIYANGFVVGNSEFRYLNQPGNTDFVNELRAGRIPEELRPLAESSSGELAIELVQYEVDYNPHIPTVSSGAASEHIASGAKGHAKPILFTGNGVTLSTLSTPISGTPTLSSKDFPTPTIDASSPLVQVRIRLPGGAQIVRSFNRDTPGSSILDIVSFGLHVAPETITIAAGYPPRPLDPKDLDNLSIKDLGLANSTINVYHK